MELSNTFATVERHDSITIITMQRPEVLNALNSHAHRELAQIFDQFFDDNSQRVAILTGSGSRAFCAGNDVKEQASAGSLQRPPSGFGGITSRFDRLKPVIAAVNGLALGGGFEMALACDLVVAGTHATFGLPEPRIGLAALAGGLLRLPQQIGLKRAMDLILTARSMTAQEAFEFGLVNRLVEPADVRQQAINLAHQISFNSPRAIAASLQVVRLGTDGPPLSVAMDEQRRLPAVVQMLNGRDFVEGPLAFAQKRPPKWEE